MNTLNASCTSLAPQYRDAFDKANLPDGTTTEYDAAEQARFIGLASKMADLSDALAAGLDSAVPPTGTETTVRDAIDQLTSTSASLRTLAGNLRREGTISETDRSTFTAELTKAKTALESLGLLGPDACGALASYY